MLLGFVPAWGATQLAPKLVGADAAVKLIVHNPLRQNKMLDARKAQEIGLVDRVVAPERLIDEAIALAEESPPREDADLSDLAEVVRKARLQVEDVVHGAAPAPYRALELIAGSAEWPIEDGYRAEQEALADLLETRQAQASLYAFDLVERRATRQVGRPDVDDAPRSGRSASPAPASWPAARTLLLPTAAGAGCPARLDGRRSPARDRVDAATSWRPPRHADASPRRPRSRSPLSERHDRWKDFADCDLVIEAVFEEIDVSVRCCSVSSRSHLPECVLATTLGLCRVTERGRASSIRIASVASISSTVALMRPSSRSSAHRDGRRHTWRRPRRHDKLRSGPSRERRAGFVVNRLLTRMTVSLGAIENGNSVEEPTRHCSGWARRGSVGSAQMVGPRVANHVLRTLNAVYPDRFPLSRPWRTTRTGRWRSPSRARSRRARNEILEAAREVLPTRHGTCSTKGGRLG